MLRAVHVEGCGFAKQRRHDEREAGGQLLHRAADDRMRFGLMPPLQDGTERPAGRSRIRISRNPRSSGPPKPSRTISGATSRRGAGQADQHGDDRGAMQSVAAGNERIDADHPERRQRDEDRRQAARHPLLGEYQAARADSDDDDAEERGVPELAARWEMCALEKYATSSRMPAGDGVAQAQQHRRRHGFERDADAQVRGAPEETDRGERQVRLKMRMARQNSG